MSPPSLKASGTKGYSGVLFISGLVVLFTLSQLGHARRGPWFEVGVKREARTPLGFRVQILLPKPQPNFAKIQKAQSMASAACEDAWMQSKEKPCSAYREGNMSTAKALPSRGAIKTHHASHPYAHYTLGQHMRLHCASIRVFALI